MSLTAKIPSEQWDAHSVRTKQEFRPMENRADFCFSFYTHSGAYVLWVRCLAELPMLFTLKIVSASHLKMFDEQE